MGNGCAVFVVLVLVGYGCLALLGELGALVFLLGVATVALTMLGGLHGRLDEIEKKLDALLAERQAETAPEGEAEKAALSGEEENT